MANFCTITCLKSYSNRLFHRICTDTDSCKQTQVLLVKLITDLLFLAQRSQISWLTSVCDICVTLPYQNGCCDKDRLLFSTTGFFFGFVLLLTKEKHEIIYWKIIDLSTRADNMKYLATEIIQSWLSSGGSSVCVVVIYFTFNFWVNMGEILYIINGAGVFFFFFF